MDGAKRLAMVETKTISGGAAVTPLVSMFRYQLGNHLGSAVLEVDAAGLIISYEELAPFGTSAYRSSRSGVDVSARRYRYVGLERDNETGLYSMGARYYAAWLGRWTSADPLGIGADGPGVYNYTRGSPVVFTDPGGMEAESSERGPTRKFLENKLANRKEAPAPEKKYEILVDPEAGNISQLLSGIRDEAIDAEVSILEARTNAHAGQAYVDSQTRKLTEAFFRGTGIESLPTSWAETKARLAEFDVTGLKAVEGIGRATVAMGENFVARLSGDTEAWAENAGAALALAVSEGVVAGAGSPSAAPKLSKTADAVVAKQAPSRPPIFADTDVLVAAAEKGHVGALEEIRGGVTHITPNQLREFLDVEPAAQRASRRRFLKAEGVQVYGGPRAGAAASGTDFRTVFEAVIKAKHSRGDAALGAFAKETGIEAVTMEKRLSNFFLKTQPRLGVPIRRLK